MISVDGILDPPNREIRVGKSRRRFTGMQWRLLELLVKRNGWISHERIYEILYGHFAEGRSDKLVRVHICHIRKKLEGSALTIATAYGLGYRLERAA